MTHFLVSEEKPEGYKLEEVLSLLRKDIVRRAGKILDDDRPEARKVLENDIKILGLLNDCIAAAEDSTHILEKSFGRGRLGEPRIGTL